MGFKAIIIMSLAVVVFSSNCFKGCFQCDTSINRCVACYEGFQLSVSGVCVEARIANCRTYLDRDQCSRCAPTYRLFQNTCLKQYDGCLRYNSNQRCQLCSSELRLSDGLCYGVLNCKSYSNTNRCIQCTDGFDLISNRCIQNFKSCQATNPQSGVCIRCGKGFELIGYKCVKDQVYNPNCYLYDEFGRCYFCKDGYVLWQDVCFGKDELVLVQQKWNPLISEPISQQVSLPVVPAQQTASTQRYTSAIPIQQIPTSSQNLVIPSQQLQSAIQQLPNPIQQLQNPDRTVRNQETSSTKIQPIRRNQQSSSQNPPEKQVLNLVIPATSSNLSAEQAVQKLINIYCQQFDKQRNCLRCYQSYFLSQKGICNRINSLCKTFDHQKKVCVDCYRGYELIGGNCRIQRKQIKDPNCRVFQKDQCKQCYHNFYILKGKCTASNPLCKEIQLDGRCKSCYDGYDLKNGQCQNSLNNIPNKKDPFCVGQQQGQCVQCANGYYVNPQTKLCVPLSLNCIEHNLQTGQCIKCLPSFALINNVCIQQRPNCLQYGDSQCIRCENGHFLKNGLCYKNDVTCETYDSRGQCVKCVITYFLVNGECVFPSLGFDALCEKYKNSYCVQCKKGSFLTNFRCRPIDQNCLSFDYNSQTCQKCALGMTPKGSSCS